MNHHLYFTNSLVTACILFLWTAKMNQATSEFVQNFSSPTFTTSFSIPYSIIKSENSAKSQECNANATDDFTTLVRRSLRRRDNFDVSTLQELLVRGFEILCLWTQPTKEKYRIRSKLKPENSSILFTLPDASFLSPEYGQFDFHNMTLHNFPSHDEKVLANPLNEKCAHVFETTYQAKSNKTTIRGEMLANGIRTEFILMYQNATLRLNDIKKRTQTGRIFSTRVRTEFEFDSFVAQTTSPQDVRFLLDSVTPLLLDEVIAKDSSHRLAYSSVEQDVKIADLYRREILRLMSTVLAHYVRTRYRQPYRLPADPTRHLSESIDFIQIDGLDRCRVCESNMQLNPRASNFAMKLKFSIKFPDNGDQKNLTNITIRERGSIPQNRTFFVEKVLVGLDFSSPLQSETSHKHNFHLTAVKAQIADVRKYRPLWYGSYKTKLNALVSEIMAEIVLSWILYDTN